MKTVDSLAGLYLDTRDGLRRHGRAGGAAPLALALVLVGLGALCRSWAAEREAGKLLFRVGELRTLSALLFVIALALAVGGALQIARPRPPRGAEHPPLEVEALLALARAAERPFYVCLECRRLWTRTESAGRCPQCDSAGDCLEVTSDSDLAMAEAALR